MPKIFLKINFNKIIFLLISLIKFIFTSTNTCKSNNIISRRKVAEFPILRKTRNTQSPNIHINIDNDNIQNKEETTYIKKLNECTEMKELYTKEIRVIEEIIEKINNKHFTDIEKMYETKQNNLILANYKVEKYNNLLNNNYNDIRNKNINEKFNKYKKMEKSYIEQIKIIEDAVYKINRGYLEDVYAMYETKKKELIETEKKKKKYSNLLNNKNKNNKVNILSKYRNHNKYGKNNSEKLSNSFYIS